jgi:hypothetical protein
MFLAAAVALATAFPAFAEAPYQTAWIRQLGSANADYGIGMSADGLGNVFLSGHTSGDLGGPNAGPRDAFVAKYDAAGNHLWTRQFGTAADDYGCFVSADGVGGVYITGSTTGSLGGPSAGGYDVFLSKYDTGGNLLWGRQFGTAVTDYGGGVCADLVGNVYVSGVTAGSLEGANAGSYDAFLRKYDSAGNHLWTRQFGTAASEYGGADVSADHQGNAYVSGCTYGSLGGPNAGSGDSFVGKFDAAGNRIWLTQIGSADLDSAALVSADPLGNVYIGGHTYGDLGGTNAGNADAFVSKLDAAGNVLWTRQLGTAAYEGNTTFGLSADSLGNVFISGNTGGSLGGPNAGGDDAFLAKFDTQGKHLWTYQFGTSSGDGGWRLSADALGNLYMAGTTWGGSLGGPNAGGPDAFVAKFVAPEPSTLALLGVGAISLLAYAWRRRKRAA